MKNSIMASKTFHRGKYYITFKRGFEDSKKDITVTVDKVFESDSLKISLSDEDNPQFLCVLIITRLDYEDLKKQQGLLVDFDNFPSQLVRLLQQCASNNMFLIMQQTNPVQYYFEVVEHNEFKRLVHLSLRTGPATDADIKQHMADTITHLKKTLSSVKSSSSSTEAHLNDKCINLERKVHDLSHVITKMEEDKLRREMEFQESLKLEKERLDMERHQWQNNTEMNMKAQIGEFQENINKKDRHIEELNAACKQLKENIMQLENQISEKSQRLNCLEKEVQKTHIEVATLKAKNATLERDIAEKDKQYSLLTSRCTYLDKVVKENSDTIKELNNNVSILRKEKTSLEERLALSESLSKKNNEAVQSTSEQLLKANQIISKQNADLIEMKEKLLCRTAIALEQEKVIERNGKEMDDLKSKISSTNQEMEKLTQELTSFKEKYEANEMALKERDETIKNNNMVIQWLHKKLEDTCGPSEALTGSGRGQPGALSAISSTPYFISKNHTTSSRANSDDSVDFYDTSKLEYLPGNFGRLANLRILELRDNYLMILPKSLSRSTELLRLDIGQNDFQQFPEVIGRFTKLKELWIDSNSLTNITGVIKPLEYLVHLEASNNMIEELAPEIGYCTRLEAISLSLNNLTQLPDSIGQLSNLTSLKLDNNKLYCLPESIGQLANLEELMLMSNYLDKMPSSIGLLRKLQYLNADENMLRSIPPEIGSCSKLSVLSLRANKLIKIPPEIGHLSALKVLNLVRNSLTYLPQSLLNCENLVALWLSENQSKPLVPMHSEVDPHTYEQVLTCFLFPQVPLNPIESKLENNSKPEINESQSTPRHISFVDMKAVPKVAEKGGQLRRAPTPYPKELRALAKHARNIHKDGAQDVTPLQNAVHIKAAKITPTLQQRFASDNKKEQDTSQDAPDEVNDPMKVSVYDNLPTENTYDKPLDLTYEPNKTYRSVDHALYTESNGGPEEQNTDDFCPPQRTTSVKPNDKIYASRQDVERMTPIQQIPQNVYGTHMESTYPVDNKFRSSLEETRNRLQRLSLSSQDRHINNETMLSPHFSENSYNARPVDNVPSFEPMYPRKDHVCHSVSDNSYHESGYGSETYARAKEKMYQQRNYDAYGYHAHVSRDIPSPRLHTVSQVVSSNTMPNLSNYNNMYGQNTDGHSHDYGQIHHSGTPNANIYGMSASASSPTYVANQSPDLYSPTGHTNTTNPYRMTNTPLISDDGSYSHVHIHSPTSQNMYDLYEAIPASSNSTSVISHHHSPKSLPEPVYNRGQPPPYHIAAPYTKHAQYFNGTGG